MPQDLYKQLEEAYQKGVNKEHKPNPARMHPMSSQQGKGCPEMLITQTESAQYSHDSHNSQLDSDQDFDVTTVNPNAESTRMDGTHSRPQDGHALHHTKPTAWTSTDISECLVTCRAHTPGIATAQPAEKTKSGTSKVSWTKHKETQEACQMTSEN